MWRALRSFPASCRAASSSCASWTATQTSCRQTRRLPRAVDWQKLRRRRVDCLVSEARPDTSTGHARVLLLPVSLSNCGRAYVYRTLSLMAGRAGCRAASPDCKEAASGLRRQRCRRGCGRRCCGREDQCRYAAGERTAASRAIQTWTGITQTTFCVLFGCVNRARPAARVAGCT